MTEASPPPAADAPAPQAPGKSSLRSLSFLLLLAGFWLSLSGHFTALLLGLGAGSVGLVAYLAHRMDVVDREGHPVQLSPRMPGYWSWLAKEILLASWAVLKLITTLGHRPAVGRIPRRNLSEVGVAILANSVTLTPGTLSMRVIGNDVEVHSLDESLLADLNTDRLPARVRAFDKSDA